MIEIYQGETLKKEVAVFNTDGTPADLSGITMSAGLGQSGNTIPIIPTKAGNIVSIRHTATSELTGVHELEIKIKDAQSDVETIHRESVMVKKSVIPNFT